MKYISSLLIVAIAIFLMNTYNEDPGTLQDNMETTDVRYIQINQPGPRTFDEAGETWDKEEDKKVIREAAERVPNVKVTSVTIENKTARIKVKVNQAMTEFDRFDWQNNIKSAVQGAIPRYDIYVTVE